jgi:dihydrofolate synthase / folylpolyglutamate synthase
LQEYKNTLNFLFRLQKFGMKFGLENIKQLLDFLENPETKYPTVHIAGTNGKGSTAAMIASILTASGYKTGLYTSPHLIDFTERIRIDGKPISSKEVVIYARKLRSQIQKTKATFFEATTAIAFQYFSDKNVDVAVIETGLGGRLDATNVIKPELSIITTIGMDHSEQLGNTVLSIASEKAGIIKSRTPCITAVKHTIALKIIKSIAKDNHSQLFEVSKFVKLKVISNDIHSLNVSLQIKDLKLKNVKVGLVGSYQRDNIKLAVTAVKLLRENSKFDRVRKQTIVEGLRDIRKNTGLRGRFEVLSALPIIIGDVAHNPQGFEALSKSLIEVGLHGVITVFGMMEDKDVDSVLPYLMKASKFVVACQPKIKRALKSQIIVEKLHKQEFPCSNGISVPHSIEIAKSRAQVGDTMLICGSHYVLSEAITFLNKIPKKLDF